MRSGDGAVIGAATGGSGRVDDTGSSSQWTIGSDLVVGNAGTGSLAIGAGSIVEAASLSIADAGAGFLSVSGAEAKLSISGNAQFGMDGSSNVTIADGGQVSAGGTAELGDGDTTLDGGTVDVSRMLTLESDQLLSGHSTVEASSVINSATVQASGGTLDFIGGVVGDGRVEIEAASTLDLASQVGSGQETLFEAANSRLVLGAPASFAGTIYNFIKGDTIDLSKTVVSGVAYHAQTLTVFESDGASIALKFAGNCGKSSFGMTSDGHGGTFITHI